jgi:hypothetical protein
MFFILKRKPGIQIKLHQFLVEIQSFLLVLRVNINSIKKFLELIDFSKHIRPLTKKA